MGIIIIHYRCHGAAAERGRAQPERDSRTANLPRRAHGRTRPPRTHPPRHVHPQPATGLRESGRAHGPGGL